MQGSANLWRDIAVLRGLEQRRPEGGRLVDDPVSLRLLPAASRGLIRVLQSTGLADAILRRRERQLPGVIGSLLCRTRYMDDVLRESLEDGVRQVAILGAGFDTRAYRVPGLEGVEVFEVDHPAVQDSKRKALERASIALPSNVTLVGVDFDHDDLGDVLAEAGFRPGVRTLFIWEGVTQYISRDAIADTLAWVATVAAPGSRLVFSYVREDVISGVRASAAERKVMARAEGGGAPWRTGFDPAGMSVLLERHGLEMVEELGGEDYRKRYLEPAGRDLATLRAERVVLAQLPVGDSGSTTEREGRS
ncbi:MAG: SAM-dependent methyltransferase [Gemmatimonadota bacterium]|jgi:methyltransferase (TIGR00027 family)